MAERMGTSIVSGGESEVENYSLYPPGSKVPHDICERIITKSQTVSQKLLKNVHLDAETLSSLVSRDVITPENSTLMRNEAFAPSSRIFDILRPALLKGGARSLEAFYRTLVTTSEGRMGHAELAADIKKRVDYYLRKEPENSSPLGRSGTPRSGSRPTVDHVPAADSTEDDVHYKLPHSQHLYVKQSSLPVDVERDNKKKTSVVHRHLSDDGTYKGKPRSQPKVANTQDADSDSSLCSTDRDGSGRSKQQPSAASLMKALETEYVEKFKEDHGAVRRCFIKELTLNRHLRGNRAPLLLTEWLLSAENAKKVAECANPQISDIVDLWIGKRLKGSGLFGMATCLARVQGLGRYITCIVQQTGACTAAELAHFTKALGHTWVMFAQKIGYKEDELKVKGSSKISKKAFFASIWQVPKFDKDQLKGLFCELLTVTEQQDVLRNFRSRLSKAATGHGLDALPHSESSTITMSSLTSAQCPVHPPARSRAESSGNESGSSIITSTTDSDTPAETDTDVLQKEGSTAAAAMSEWQDSIAAAESASHQCTGIPSSAAQLDSTKHSRPARRISREESGPQEIGPAVHYVPNQRPQDVLRNLFHGASVSEEANFDDSPEPQDYELECSRPARLISRVESSPQGEASGGASGRMEELKEWEDIVAFIQRYFDEKKTHRDVFREILMEVLGVRARQYLRPSLSRHELSAALQAVVREYSMTWFQFAQYLLRAKSARPFIFDIEKHTGGSIPLMFTEVLKLCLGRSWYQLATTMGLPRRPLEAIQVEFYHDLLMQIVTFLGKYKFPTFESNQRTAEFLIETLEKASLPQVAADVKRDLKNMLNIEIGSAVQSVPNQRPLDVLCTLFDGLGASFSEEAYFDDSPEPQDYGSVDPRNSQLMSHCNDPETRQSPSSEPVRKQPASAADTGQARNEVKVIHAFDDTPDLVLKSPQNIRRTSPDRDPKAHGLGVYRVQPKSRHGVSAVSIDSGFGVSAVSSDSGYRVSAVSSDSGYRVSAVSIVSKSGCSAVSMADPDCSGSSTAPTSHPASSVAQQYQGMRVQPHDEEILMSLEEYEAMTKRQGSKVPSQSAGGGSDPPKEPSTAAVKAAEAKLDELCWIPLGIQSQYVGPDGEKLCLQPSAGSVRWEEGDTIFLEVPPGAVSSSETVEIRSAVIPYGPFTLPEGYELGGMVVYINYNGRRVTQPLKLSLPHWYGGKDHVRDGLSFAIAPHTLKEGEHTYRFELLEGGRSLSSHCGELEIDGHCSLFAEVFRKGAIPRCQAISLRKEEGDEATCNVVVTYAFTQWCDILAKHRQGCTISNTCSFTFGEGGLKGKLRKESGNGWKAAIDGSSEVQLRDVNYESRGITSSEMLRRAVLNGGYPPSIKWVVTYREELRMKGTPVFVHFDLFGAGTELTFICKAYEETDQQQYDGSENAAAALQSTLTPPPNHPPLDVTANTHPTALPHAEIATVSPLKPVSDTTSTASPNPPQQPAATPVTARNILAALNHQLDAKWPHVGTFLGVEYHVIESVSKGNGGSAGDCMLHLVSKWTTKQAGTGNLPRTWQTVIEAVQSSGDTALAQILARKHGVHLPS